MRFDDLQRIELAHLPTPVVRPAALERLAGTPTWVKRDDATGGAEAGNKIRKLEYLLAEARQLGADGVLTCGGAQSNHARATALAAAQLGLSSGLLLRSSEPEAEPWAGNLFLDRLAGASIRWVSPAHYAERDARLEAWRLELEAAGRSAYVVPEGGSNALGSMGYVRAMQELRGQLDRARGNLPSRFRRLVVACGSGGTAAGVALGAARFGLADEVVAIAVCDDRAFFERRVSELTRAARALVDDLGEPVPTRVEDAFIGPGYGRASTEQLRFIARVASATGLVLDPVYSGKALFALAELELEGPTLFLHTGGLPGLLAQASHFPPES